MQIEGGPEQPLLQKQDLIGIAKPGQQVEDLIRKAYQIQIDEGITDKEAVKNRLNNP